MGSFFEYQHYSVTTILQVVTPISFLKNVILGSSLQYRFSKITPSLFTIKEGSTFLTKPLFPQEREDVTALRCSEPLRYKVGGPSKVSPYYAGWDRLNCSSLQYRSTLVAARMRNIPDCDSSSYATFIGLKYSTTQQEYKRVKKNS